MFSLKLVIKFDNWNGDNTSYFHDFFPYNGLNFETFDELSLQNILLVYMIGKKLCWVV